MATVQFEHQRPYVSPYAEPTLSILNQGQIKDKNRSNEPPFYNSISPHHDAGRRTIRGLVDNSDDNSDDEYVDIEEILSGMSETNITPAGSSATFRQLTAGSTQRVDPQILAFQSHESAVQHTSLPQMSSEITHRIVSYDTFEVSKAVDNKVVDILHDATEEGDGAYSAETSHSPTVFSVEMTSDHTASKLLTSHNIPTQTPQPLGSSAAASFQQSSSKGSTPPRHTRQLVDTTTSHHKQLGKSSSTTSSRTPSPVCITSNDVIAPSPATLCESVGIPVQGHLHLIVAENSSVTYSLTFSQVEEERQYAATSKATRSDILATDPSQQWEIRKITDRKVVGNEIFFQVEWEKTWFLSLRWLERRN